MVTLHHANIEADMARGATGA